MCAQLAERNTRMQLVYEAFVQQSVPNSKVNSIANANKRAIEENTGGAASKRFKTQSVNADDVDRIYIDD